MDSLIGLPRLVTLILYSNPLLGPTGEDPTFIYIENLVERASKIREDANSNIKDIEVSMQFLRIATAY